MRSAAANSSWTERSSDSQRRNASTTAGSNCAPTPAGSPRAVPSLRPPIGPVARHRVEGSATAKTRAPIGISSPRAGPGSRAVPPLVVASDDASPVAVEEGDAAEHLLAEHRVRLHEPPLGLVSGPASGGSRRGSRSCRRRGGGSRTRRSGSARAPGRCPRRARSRSAGRARSGARARVLRLERARERRDGLLVGLLDEECAGRARPRAGGGGRGVEDQLLGRSALAGGAERDAVEAAGEALDDGEQLERAERLDEERVGAGRGRRPRAYSSSEPVRRTTPMRAVDSSPLSTRQYSRPLIARHRTSSTTTSGRTRGTSTPRCSALAASSTSMSTISKVVRSRALKPPSSSTIKSRRTFPPSIGSLSFIG